MSRNRLIQRFKWLYLVEKFHALITFPGFLVYILLSHHIKDTILVSYGLIVCIIILYQGQYYWRLKLKKLKGENFELIKNIQYFNNSKKVNQILIGIMPLVFLIQMSLQDWSFLNNRLLFWGLLINIFGVLEYVNYYHIQLMIDNKYDLDYVVRNKRLKKASLAIDLLRNEI